MFDHQLTKNFQANAGQWGDNANQQQWSATVGKSRPNQQQPPANWGGVDDLNWNTPQVRQHTVLMLLFVVMFAFGKC